MIVCPECKKEMKILPERDALPLSITSDTSLTFASQTITLTGQSYSPTSKTFKCSNEKCWVTKLSLSWS